MMIRNPLALNDWELKKFIRFIVIIQLLISILIIEEYPLIDISIIRVFICFFYLTFIPGFLILRILKLHYLGNVKTLLFAVGFSISTLMFMGLFINFTYPLFGISEPLSYESLFISISILIIILSFLCYIRDREFNGSSYLQISNYFSSSLLLSFLIFILAILGSFLLAYFKQNLIAMVAIILILIVVLIFGFNKILPKKIYPLIIFIIALSILYISHFTSFYLTGSDVHRQYFVSKIVLQNSYWNPSLYPSGINSMASITMIPVIYSKILNLDLTWVFKVIYPIFFAFVPIGLYELYKRYTSEKISFLASFFFISFFEFWALDSMTQYLGEFFLVLLLLWTFRDEHKRNIKIILVSIIFVFSMIISHYGTSLLILFFYLIPGYIIFWILQTRGHGNLKKKISFFYTTYHTIFNISFIFLIFVLSIVWYTYIAGGPVFQTSIHIAKAVYDGLSNYFSPISQEAGLQNALGGGNMSILRTINWLLFVFSVIMIIFGFLIIFFNKIGGDFKFRNEWKSISYASIFLVAISIVLPNFSISYNFERIYHLSLFFLSPIMMLGLFQLLILLEKITKKIKKHKFDIFKNHNKNNTKIIVSSLFVFLYFSFNSGIIYELTGDIPATTASISLERIKNSSKPEIFSSYYLNNWSVGDITGAKWLSKNRDNKSIFADLVSGPHILRSYGLIDDKDIFLIDNDTVNKNGYFYLFELNLKRGIITLPNPYVHNKKLFLNYSNFSWKFNYFDNIYSNGDAVLLYKNSTLI